MPKLSGRGRALSVMALAATMLVVASVVYLRVGGGAAQPGSRALATGFLGPAQFLSQRTGWVALNGSLLGTTDGGSHWRLMLIVPRMSATWIQLFDDRHGLVLESSSVASAPGDRLIRTDDGGAHWTDEQLPAKGSMVRAGSLVAFPDRDRGWYVAGETSGSGPKDLTVYRTDDGGTHWNQMQAVDYLHPSDHGLIRGGQPVGLDFTDAEKGWLIQAPVVVADAVLSMTTDGGATWQGVALPAPPGDQRPLSHVEVPTVFPDGTALLTAVRGFVDGTAYVYRSADGGRTWGQPVQLEQPPGTTAFVDSSHWWHAAGNLTARTSDGGRTWQSGALAPNGLSFAWLQPVGNRSAWAIGVRAEQADLTATGLLRTEDGGDHWSAVPLDASA